jgi:hypothetical protein
MAMVEQAYRLYDVWPQMGGIMLHDILMGFDQFKTGFELTAVDPETEILARLLAGVQSSGGSTAKASGVDPFSPPAWYRNVNPTKEEVNSELEKLGKKHNVPLKALTSLIDAESNYRQFDKNGNPNYPYDKNGNLLSSAAGLGQITRYTANLKGNSFDYEKIKFDWKYNLTCAVEIYAQGYHHPWNRNVENEEIRATRSYGMYHDGMEVYRDVNGLRGSYSENYYLKYYK